MVAANPDRPSHKSSWSVGCDGAEAHRFRLAMRLAAACESPPSGATNARLCEPDSTPHDRVRNVQLSKLPPSWQTRDKALSCGRTLACKHRPDANGANNRPTRPRHPEGSAAGQHSSHLPGYVAPPAPNRYHRASSQPLHRHATPIAQATVKLPNYGNLSPSADHSDSAGAGPLLTTDLSEAMP